MARMQAVPMATLPSDPRSCTCLGQVPSCVHGGTMVKIALNFLASESLFISPSLGDACRPTGGGFSS